MTVLVALKEENKIFIGADRQSTAGQLIFNKKEPKIVEKKFKIVDGYNKKVNEDKLLIGVTGYGFLNNFIKYGFDFPDMRDNIEDFEEYLIRDVFKALQKKLTEYKLSQVNNGVLDTGSAFLIIYKNNMYEIESNLGVIVLGGEYNALGSGKEIALGSLHSTTDTGYSAKQRIGMAITAAADHTIYVNHEYDIFEIEKDTIQNK